MAPRMTYRVATARPRRRALASQPDPSAVAAVAAIVPRGRSRRRRGGGRGGGRGGRSERRRDRQWHPVTTVTTVTVTITAVADDRAGAWLLGRSEGEERRRPWGDGVRSDVGRCGHSGRRRGTGSHGQERRVGQRRRPRPCIIVIRRRECNIGCERGERRRERPIAIAIAIAAFGVAPVPAEPAWRAAGPAAGHRPPRIRLTATTATTAAAAGSGATVIGIVDVIDQAATRGDQTDARGRCRCTDLVTDSVTGVVTGVITGVVASCASRLSGRAV